MAKDYEIPATPATKNDNLKITGIELQTFSKEWAKENDIPEDNQIVITGSVEMVLSTELEQGLVIKLEDNKKKNIKMTKGGKGEEIA